MKVKKSSGTYQLAPEGTTQAVVVDVIDEGMQPGYNPGEMVPKVKLAFQTEEETTEGKPFLVHSFPLNASVNSKSTLYKEFIKPILGRDLEADDFDDDNDIDLDALLMGKNANITIKHTEKGEKTYANIVTVGTLPAKQAKAGLLEPRDYVRKQDREDDTSFNFGDNVKEEAEAATAAI